MTEPRKIRQKGIRDGVDGPSRCFGGPDRAKGRHSGDERTLTGAKAGAGRSCLQGNQRRRRHRGRGRREDMLLLSESTDMVKLALSEAEKLRSRQGKRRIQTDKESDVVNGAGDKLVLPGEPVFVVPAGEPRKNQTSGGGTLLASARAKPWIRIQDLPVKPSIRMEGYGDV